MAETPNLDQPFIDAEPIARRVAAGEPGAFQLLMAALWEPCFGLVRASKALKGLAGSDDDALEVVTRVMSRLERDDYRALGLYIDWHQRHPDKTFADWFKITAANVVRDYARERRGSDRRRVPGELSKKRLLNDFAVSLPLDVMGARPPMTDAQTARQLLEFARDKLAAPQLEALEAWLQGADYAAIATMQGLEDAAAAKRRVRAAVAVLRRHFGSAS